jgi:hypothetical protein
MPDVQEVFRVATQKVRPDPGALERQQDQQRRRMTRRKAGAYALAAALFAAIAVVAVRAAVDPAEPKDVGTQPPRSTPIVPARDPVGTVTSNGSTCSIEMTAQRIEPGFVPFEAVNDTDERAMFDSWVLSEGYTFAAFDRAVRRDVRFAEEGKARGAWPSEDEVTYLRSDVIPAHSSEIIAVPMSTGRHAITCLKPYEGLGSRPFGIAGPITVP